MIDESDRPRTRCEHTPERPHCSAGVKCGTYERHDGNDPQAGERDECSPTFVHPQKVKSCADAVVGGYEYNKETEKLEEVRPPARAHERHAAFPRQPVSVHHVPSRHGSLDNCYGY